MSEMPIPIPIPMKLHHGAVSVPDLDASIDWYCRVLDFTLEQRFEIPGQQTEVAMLKRGEMRVELFQAAGSKPSHPDRREPDSDFRTQGNLHFAFAVPDVHAFAAMLAERGADIVWVRDFEFGSNAFIRDNAGNLIEFVQERR
jgi:methylmalonyl-CoA/ethylmalonyl-CoA epimerase